MWSLLCGATHLILGKPRFSVALLGTDGAGKTTLLERIKSDIGGLPPAQVRPTVGVNVAHVGVSEPARCELVLSDVGGRAELRGKLWDAHYFDAHAVIFVIDAASSEDSLDTALSLLHTLAAHCIPRHTPLLVLLNKHDAAAHLAHVRRRVEGTLSRACSETPDLQRRLCRVQPIVALEGHGVRRAIAWLVEQLFKWYY